MTDTNEEHTYDIRVWEKAENWYFYESVDAKSQEEAVAKVREQYKKNKGYVVLGY